MQHVLSRFTARRAVLAGGIVGLTILAQCVGAFAQYSTPEAATEMAGATPTALTPGELTQVRSFLVPESANVTITPLLTSGEMVGDYQFAGTPDGMGAYKDGDNVVLFVNHEWTPKQPGSDEGNISGGRVSRIVLGGTTGEPVSGSYVVDGTEGWWDLCSASLASPANGYDKTFFLSGEETTDGPMGGQSFAVDAESGKVTALPWLGYIDHEQELPVPGFGDKKVIFLTDDDSSGSEIY